MQLKSQAIKTQALIVHDSRRDSWAVKIGIAFVHFGSLFSCETYCRDRGIPVRNQAEINRVKYDNMPIQEMFNAD